MFRSEAMRRLARLMQVAALCERRGIGTGDALGLARKAQERAWSRREFLHVSAGAAAAVSLGLAGRAVARPVRGSPRVVIVGAGLAGLVCADTLRHSGLSATVYEAHATRLGGRCYSLRGLVTGKVAENGGEFIDTTHKTMRAYANEFNLAREDVGRAPGEVAYFFGGQRFTDEEVVEEYRQLVERMRPDLQASSGEPTFFAHNAADVALDRISLEQYLALRAGDLPLVRAAISEAYVAEYGLEPGQQSCLNMLLFVHLDKRRRFTPFGVFSDERFHLVGGNDAIATKHRGATAGTSADGYEVDAAGDEQRGRVRAAVC
jgi:monoamine oxidase